MHKSEAHKKPLKEGFTLPLGCHLGHIAWPPCPDRQVGRASALLDEMPDVSVPATRDQGPILECGELRQEIIC